MAEKIVGLLDDPTLRMEMGEYGRRRIKTDLSWDHQIEALVTAYQRAVQRWVTHLDAGAESVDAALRAVGQIAAA